jgi:hypothetical protein
MNDRYSLQAKTVNMTGYNHFYRNCSSTVAKPVKRNADATAIAPLTYANVFLFFKEARIVSLIDLFDSSLGPRIGYRCLAGFSASISFARQLWRRRTIT